MTDAQERFENPRQHPRVATQVEVDIRFPDLHTFIQEYSENVSLGGMFIKADEPRPVGSTFEFRLHLGDGFDIIRGTGQVVWVRGQKVDESPGMGVRFLELDEQSRRVIEKMVRNRLQHGAKEAGPNA